MLTRIEIDSFKAFEHAEVTLRPFTLVAGPNGTGKTSVLQAIEFLGAMTRDSLKDALDYRHWDYADLPRLHAPTKEFGFTAHITLDDAEIEWELRFGKRRSPGVASELVRRDGSDLLRRRGRRMQRLDESRDEWETVTQTLTSSWLSTVTREDRGRYPALLGLANWARNVRRYVALAPESLREPSRRTEDGMGASGEHLAGFLRFLRDRRPDRFGAVVERVKTYYPELADIHVKGGAYGWNRIEILEDWQSGPVPFNARQVSDGLLRVLAVAAIFELDDPPSVLMLDEVENGLHPHLLGGLVDLLRQLAHERGVQVIVTSHSPIALNYVEDASAVLIAHRVSDGSVELTPLSETSGYRKLGAELDLGELWYNLGESRLLR